MSSGAMAVPMVLELPPGILGPDPATMDVRAFFLPHATGLVLVDTGMDADGRALDQALVGLGATWDDVSHVVITHAHPDHVGALGHVRDQAGNARLLAHPADDIAGAEPLLDGEVIAGQLVAVGTPGHTPGHLSLFDEGTGELVVGDCLGSVRGRLVRAPAPFTADATAAEASIERLGTFHGARMLFSHGAEIDDAWEQFDGLTGCPTRAASDPA
jgi:glyoxylase-like metal-dependent hydrolase (beta-lactamase superfamily II)